MPQTNEGILLVVGAIFLLIGLLGGGVEIAAAKIPSVGKYPRIFSTGIGVILMGIAVSRLIFPPLSPQATVAPAGVEMPTPLPTLIAVAPTETPMPPTNTHDPSTDTPVPKPADIPTTEPTQTFTPEPSPTPTPTLVPAQGNPVFDNERIIDPVVIIDNGLYKMWYSGEGVDGKFRLGYATSADGINWSKYVSNPVLDVGAVGAWDSDMVRVNAIIKNGSTYQMWYNSNYYQGRALGPGGGILGNRSMDVR